MCGRYSIYESMDHYLKELAPTQLVINGYDLWPIERYNVAPTSRIEIIRTTNDGLRVDKVRWGWSPSWAKGKRPDPFNARIETVLGGTFFNTLWPKRRVLVPANGWFEWAKDAQDPKTRQPFFIRLKNSAPLFFAGLADVEEGPNADEHNGFVILTTASDPGMMALHDRRPVVLTPEHAREWIDPATSSERAEKVAREGCRSTDDLTWDAVSKDVGRSDAQGPHLIKPLGKWPPASYDVPSHRRDANQLDFVFDDGARVIGRENHTAVAQALTDVTLEQDFEAAPLRINVQRAK
jgi:putative SOS response-associated peptidase YedK